MQRIAPAGCVVFAGSRNAWRARFGIPAHETLGVEASSALCNFRCAGGHRRNEVLAGHRLPIVPAKIFFQSGAEAFPPDQCLDHAHDFRALLIDRRGIEIVDLDIAGGPHRMRHRAGILGELRGAQRAHFLDARRRTVMHVGAEFLVAENRQPFLERQLEPVTAGDAVAGPVVEVLMRNDAVDVLEIGIGRQIGARQHVLGIENVEPFVLHRPHVEIADGDDHVMVEIAFEAEARFVPAHRLLQRRHRVRTLVELARLDVDRQLHRAPGRGRKRIAQYVELAGDHGKEITRLPERVLPDGVMAPVRLIAGSDRIAVGEQYRERRLVGMQRHRITRHHVRPVGKPGDAAETLRLALGEITVPRTVKAGQGRVRIGLDAHHRL